MHCQEKRGWQAIYQIPPVTTLARKMALTKIIQSECLTAHNLATTNTDRQPHSPKCFRQHQQSLSIKTGPRAGNWLTVGTQI